MSKWRSEDTNEVRDTLAILKADIEPAIQAINSAMDNLQANIGENEALAGNAFENINTTIDTYFKPITAGFKTFNDEVQSGLRVYTDASNTLVAAGVTKIDSVKLTEALENEQRNKLALESLAALTATVTGPTGLLVLKSIEAMPQMKAYMDGIDDKIDLIQKKLTAYDDFKSSVKGAFTSAVETYDYLRQGINALSSSTISSDGTISFPAGVATTWTRKLTGKPTGQEIVGKVARPDGMSDADYKQYLAAIYKDAEVLSDEGWNKTAIRDGFLAQIQASVAVEGVKSYRQTLQNIYKAVHVIGSSVFNKMMDVAFVDNADGDRQTADMIYEVLGAKVDKNNFLQLTKVARKKYFFPPQSVDVSHFPPNQAQTGLYQGQTTKLDEQSAEMVEYLSFMSKFSSLMLNVYSSGELLGQQDNQFRYWLDKPVVDFIHQNNWSREDFHQWVEREGISHTVPWGSSDSQSHNRIDAQYVSSESSEDGTEIAILGANGRNYKDQIGGKDGYHVEVVFDDEGQTVSQWDSGVLVYAADGTVVSDPKYYQDDSVKLQIIANTDSANYAESGGSVHDGLDYDPANSDYGYESKLRVLAKKKFVATDDNVWQEYTGGQ